MPFEILSMIVIFPLSRLSRVILAVLEFTYILFWVLWNKCPQKPCNSFIGKQSIKGKIVYLGEVFFFFIGWGHINGIFMDP